MLWGGDLDISTIPTIADERDDARTWHQIAIYADARSNIESEITQCLPEEYQHYELAHLNYAVLHGTAEIVLLLHNAATLARFRQACPDAAHDCRQRASPLPSAPRQRNRKLPSGQPRIVIDKKCQPPAARTADATPAAADPLSGARPARHLLDRPAGHQRIPRTDSHPLSVGTSGASPTREFRSPQVR